MDEAHYIPSSYDAETMEVGAVGVSVDDLGPTWDWSDEHPGRLVVRLTVGCQRSGEHLPSPALGRSDIARLRRWTRGQDSLPVVLQDWYLQLSERRRQNLLDACAALPWYGWLALWLSAGG